MSTLQIRVSDELKAQAEEIFTSLGLDVSTAVRIFLTMSVENNGLPFEVRHKLVFADLQQAIYDARNRVNFNGPYQTAQEAVDAMLDDATG